ncbi:MAG TPA: mycofactocin biosynthesis peptidyl-dipeptidase MftE [Acidimicrobiales bacterium]|jgi:creatinine amidohydrolase|nr:mycofactocin biosynthesis peptidyl-dipeptidase MftE [Acidimicrobiales bacterium]
MTALADLAWPEVGTLAARGAVLLLPIGSTEQHGPHLPVTTDTDIAVAIVSDPAIRVQLPRAVVAPPLPYGSSGEHDGFPGTLSIGRDATELVLVELVRSATAAFGAVVVVCTHGGNSSAIEPAVTRLRAERRDVRAWSPRWQGDAHAGRTETSLMLAIDPERVDLPRAEPGDTRPLGQLLPELRAAGVRTVSPNGVLGDPTGASAGEGHRLLAAAVADLIGFVAGSGQGPR